MEESVVGNSLREAALFLVSTIYTSIRNNDGCHRTEQERELLDANAPRSLMEPIFNSARLHFLLSFTRFFYPISLPTSSRSRSRSPVLSNFIPHALPITHFPLYMQRQIAYKFFNKKRGQHIRL